MPKGSKGTKKYADLLAWHHRIMRQKAEDEDVEPYDFDEDISEIDEKEELLECHCEAAEDPKVEYCCDSDSELDNASERSYNDDDADWYYELKERREERKKELKKEQENVKLEALELNKRKVEEVQILVYEALRKAEQEQGNDGPCLNLFEDCTWGLISQGLVGGRTTPAIRMRATEFDLYSVDYDPSTAKKEETVEGHVRVNPNYDMCLKEMCIPRRASSERYTLETGDGKEEITVQFVGQNFLRMFVHRDIINRHEHGTIPASAPEVFEFVGIVPEFHKQVRKRLAEMEEARKHKKAKKAKKARR
ncbi:hypothetical protein F5Y13DRAFT_198900 [Hypoxylon sp. FL1857]|nr:hypothetical protein F5Y13DRAFT_198900 [Hypoxylon sp. FL1857]